MTQESPASLAGSEGAEPAGIAGLAGTPQTPSRVDEPGHRPQDSSSGSRADGSAPGLATTGAATTDADARQTAHDAATKAKGFPWCDTCEHAAVWSEIGGWHHSTPDEPFGHPAHSDPFRGHEVTTRRWANERYGDPL